MPERSVTYEILDPPAHQDAPKLDLFERLDILQRRLPEQQAALIREAVSVLAEGPTAAQEETADYIAQVAALEIQVRRAVRMINRPVCRKCEITQGFGCCMCKIAANE